MNTGSISAVSQLSVRKLSPQATTLWFVASSPVLNIAVMVVSKGVLFTIFT